jgi:hypothetical protein
MPWTKEARRTRGPIWYPLELYGGYVTSGVVTDLVKSPVTSWLPYGITKTGEVVRWAVDRLLNVADVLPYIVKNGPQGLYDIGHVVMQTLSATYDYLGGIASSIGDVSFNSIGNAITNGTPFYEHIGKAPHLGDLLNTLVNYSTFTFPRENTYDAFKWLDQYHINPVTGAIGLGIVMGCELMRRRRRSMKVAPITEEARPLPAAKAKEVGDAFGF